MRKIIFGIFTLVLISCNAQNSNKSKMSENNKTDLTDIEWKNKLTQQEYDVLRTNGTERAFTGEFNKHYEDGIYTCAGCGNELFNSTTKYDSGSGWPAFYDSIDKEKVKEIRDTSHGMYRVEVRCANCDGHLGHLFEDGPSDKTGLRYCVNSASLDFKRNKG